MSPRELPVWQLHFDILRTLREGNQLVLVAATGSGKTTQVPQMLLDGGLAGEKRIVVLQPRRVAARTVSARVAWERGVKLGGEVGYQIRFEDRTSLGTRICFVTEGILLRWLQDDPNLSDIGILIFDEFHERNLLSDVALALAKRLQRTMRPNLKLVVMSATLEAEPVAAYLGSDSQSTIHHLPSTAPVLVSEGRAFPVTVNWAEYGDRRPASEQAADAVERIVRAGEPGDILVFMPGMGEINSTINALRAAHLPERCVFLPLHGDLPPEDQDRAFGSFDTRKIVVATNVAETSVTIDGVRHVVDAGLARISRYDAERGIQALAIEEISRASSEQRAGRAGRTAPGTCWRLWTESAHLNRPPKNTPEIQRADLAEVVLLLHSLGIRQAATFDWLDKPDPVAVERAEHLLKILGALSSKSEVQSPKSEAAEAGPTLDLGPRTSDLTPVGRQMLRLPMHPRYSRMLVEAAKRDCVPAAALCAALTSGRDLLVRLGRDDSHLKEARELFEGSAASDFYTLMRAFQFAKNANFDVNQCRRHGIHGQGARQVDDTYRQLMQVAERERLVADRNEDARSEIEDGARGTSAVTKADDEALLKCLTAGLADQLAKRKDTGTLDCLLTEGRTGTLVRESVVASPLFVAGSLREVDGRGGRLTLLSLATAVKREWLEELFPQHLNATVEHLYDRTLKRVDAVRQLRFLNLVIGQEHQREVDPVASARALAAAFSRGWFELPQLDHALKQFIARVNLLAHAAPDLEFPAFDGAALLAALTRAFHGLTLAKEAQAADLKSACRAHLQPAQLEWLNELAPTAVPGPDGRPLKLLYPERDADDKSGEANPEAQLKLNDAFTLKAHPLILEGRVPVKLWLAAPDGKRLGSTTDLATWKVRTYPTLRSQIKAKYPGFAWP
jgi:ATP-dependent helicase HrpB